MRKWTQAIPVKALIIILAIISAVFLGFGISVFGSLYVEQIPVLSLVKQSQEVPYVESDLFRNSMLDEAYQTLDIEVTRSQFETDGKFDPEIIVDIKAYVEQGIFTNKNESGIAYRLGDLLGYSENKVYDFGSQELESIVTCLAAEGEYSYYTISEFESKFIDGTYRFAERELSQSELLAHLRRGELFDGEISKVVLDAEGAVVYVDFWHFDEVDLMNSLRPVGADSILDIVNHNPKWNGRLAELYNLIAEASYRLTEDYFQYNSIIVEDASAGTNFSFILSMQNGKDVFTNMRQGDKSFDWKKEIEALKKEPNNKYISFVSQNGELQFSSNIDSAKEDDWKNLQQYILYSEENFVYIAAVDATFQNADTMALEKQFYDSVIPKLPSIFWGSIFSFMILLISLIWITTVAGHVNGKEGIVLNLYDRVPTEIAAGVVIGIWLLFVASSHYMSFSTYRMTSMTQLVQNTEIAKIMYLQDVLFLTLFFFVSIIFFLIGFLSLARRIKAKTLWKNSVLRWILVQGKKLFGFSKQVYDNRSCTFKVIFAFSVFVLLHMFCLFIIYSDGIDILLLFLFVMDVIVLYHLVKDAMGRQKVRVSLRKMVEGDIQLQIPVENLKGTNLEMAKEINSLGHGLDVALEKSLKSERLKTELITNVSHDIKTPLTSIINYVDLLKREKFDDPKIQGYLDVLENKALRLKNLTEDVTEASKISTGNISLEKMNINFVELVNQVCGEFAEVFEEKSLQAVINTPKEDAIIYADGRRMWRVLENIFGNAGKYAMPGTRIYGDLVEQNGSVVFTLKNVSKNPLNISADELVERFTRGDEARNTEGSGLGLSIAQSLVELQGGKLEIELDGDLFKINIFFPSITKQSENGQEESIEPDEEIHAKEKVTFKERIARLIGRIKSFFSKS